MNKPVLFILAAGMGSRYGGLKQLEDVGPRGETIMDYSVYDAIQAGFGKVIFVIRKFFRKEFETNIIRRYDNAIDTDIVEQELEIVPSGYVVASSRVKPWGTGHAVLVASDIINTPFAVINADDFYGRDSFKILSHHLSGCFNKQGEYSMVGFKIGNTLSESGTVSRGLCTVNENNYLESVEEYHKIKRVDGIITGENSEGKCVTINEVCPVSMNMWGFTPDIFNKGWNLFEKFLKERGKEPRSEFYIPFLVNSTLEEGSARCKVLSTQGSWFGVTYKEDKDNVKEKIDILCKEGRYPVPLF